MRTNVVILGDHKQLAPVLDSEYSEGLGLGISLMERIMNLPAYQSKPEFNPKFVTQLLDNYRSHPAILDFSNTQFYDGKLRAKLPDSEAAFAYGWTQLPNKQFPVVLHSVMATCSQADNGFSWYNLVELCVVETYVNVLLEYGINGKKVVESDIGIVSPYKSQRDKLLTLFAARSGIDIGTAEFYQGREKKIIIITTVRSGKTVGFLRDEKVGVGCFFESCNTFSLSSA